MRLCLKAVALTCDWAMTYGYGLGYSLGIMLGLWLNSGGLLYYGLGLVSRLWLRLIFFSQKFSPIIIIITYGMVVPTVQIDGILIT